MKSESFVLRTESANSTGSESSPAARPPGPGAESSSKPFAVTSSSKSTRSQHPPLRPATYGLGVGELGISLGLGIIGLRLGVRLPPPSTEKCKFRPGY